MSKNSMSVKLLRLRADARLPHRASVGASGFDLYAYLPDEGYFDLTRQPARVPTGIALEFPLGVDAQVRPRSGLSGRGVGVTLGTIDADYRGELMVTMYVFGAEESYRINHGDRIAQLVFGLLAPVAIVEVEALSETERGEGGHGSTGVR